MAVEICVSKSKQLDINMCMNQRTTRVRVDSFLVLLMCLLCCVTLALGVDMNNKECSAVKQGFLTRGFNATDLLSQPVNGRNLRVCPEIDTTCCSEATEARLATHSKVQFEKTVKESITKLSSVLNTRATRFDEFFREMLANSKRGFHEMFKKTYGIIYVQNSYVFTDLFEELESYYNKGQVDLTEAMDNFFSILYQRMFTVLNAQYQFDDKYLACVGDHMKELKPFGDVPQKLSIQLKRSLVATRTFAKALAVGAETSRHMLTIKPTQECSKSLLRMQHCQGCAGYPEVKACSNYCINVMKGCLPYHANLESEWNNYVDAMDKVSDRLLTSFNIEMVVQPLDIKISEAIMNFQDNGPDVSQRVFTGCGKPILGRRRRTVSLKDIVEENLQKQRASSDDIEFEGTEEIPSDLVRNARGANKELTYESYKFNKNSEEKGAKTEKSNKNSGSGLEKLIRDIRHIVKESKRFWSHLPYQICNNEELAEGPSKDEECWNGITVGKYTSPVVGDGLINQKQNPDVFVDIQRQNSVLNEQVFSLKTITNKLQNAYQGMDVEWIDYEDPLSNYASGSGSGESPDDTEPDLPDEVGSGDDRHTNTFDPVAGNMPPIFPARDPTVPEYPVSSYPNITSNEIPGTSGASKPEMSLTRALFTYLFPLVVMWFGGLFADLL